MNSFEMAGMAQSPASFGWSGSLRGFIELGNAVGIDVVPILKDLGIYEAVTLSRGEALPTELIMRALSGLIAATGLESVPLRLAKDQSVEVLDGLVELTRQAKTVGQAVAELAAISHWRGTAFVTATETTDDLTIIRFHSLLDDQNLIKIQIDYATAFTVRAIRAFAGSDWVPEFVELARPAPIQAHEWFAHFGCPVHFNAEGWLIACDRAVLEQPVIPGQQPDARLPSVEPHYPIGIAQLVDREIVRQLSAGHAALPKVAAAMGTSVRQLQRQLELAGTTYQARLDGVRRDWARHYLLNNRIKITELAQLLGFSDPAVFTRSFTRWFGMPPRAWRKSMQQGNGSLAR